MHAAGKGSCKEANSLPWLNERGVGVYRVTTRGCSCCPSLVSLHSCLTTVLEATALKHVTLPHGKENYHYIPDDSEITATVL